MTITWSDEAALNYKSIVDDLLEKWPIDFEERTNNLLDQLKSNVSFALLSNIRSFENV